MSYNHLSKEERIEIKALLTNGCSIAGIAEQLNGSKSTISRELQRNRDPVNGEYSYSAAHKKTCERKHRANSLRTKITDKTVEIIHEKLKLKWSPQQISGRIREEQKQQGERVTFPCYQTIYNYIYLHHRLDWTNYLRIIGRKGRMRRKYGTKIREKLREEVKKKRVDARPEIINQRIRLGDFEGDTIVGAEKNIHILTHVDRRSGYLIADKLKQATAEEVHKQTVISFSKVPGDKVKSITYDNGVQFSKHEYTESKLNIPIYFAYPYHSWERGTNENTNGLLREYYPKKSAFKDIEQSDLDKVVKLINNRPRKRLNYLTPEEMFNRKGKMKVLHFGV